MYILIKAFVTIFVKFFKDLPFYSLKKKQLNTSHPLKRFFHHTSTNNTHLLHHYFILFFAPLVRKASKWPCHDYGTDSNFNGIRSSKFRFLPDTLQPPPTPSRPENLKIVRIWCTTPSDFGLGLDGGWKEGRKNISSAFWQQEYELTVGNLWESSLALLHQKNNRFYLCGAILNKKRKLRVVGIRLVGCNYCNWRFWRSQTQFLRIEYGNYSV